MNARYSLIDGLHQAQAHLGVSQAAVLRRANLPHNWLASPDQNISSDVYLRIWTAIVEEIDDENAVLAFAQSYARGPFTPPVFAFSSSETVAAGLARLAVFKPLCSPVRLEIEETPAGLRVDLRVPGHEHILPPLFELSEMIYILECVRAFTGHDVVPISLGTSVPVRCPDIALDIFKSPPTVTGVTRILFTQEDAARQLVTRSASLWDRLKPMLTEELQALERDHTTTRQVRDVLIEALPAGDSRIDGIAKRMMMSKRSLQRRLENEGTRFSDVLASVREDLAKRYLTQSQLSVPEISYLLGYGDTGSFFRAFQGWFATTPARFRASSQYRS